MSSKASYGPKGTEIKGNSDLIRVTDAVVDTSGAHAAGDVVSNLTIEGWGRALKWSSILTGISVMDESGSLTGDLDFHFFKSSQSFTANSAFDPAAAKNADYMGFVTLSSDDIKSFSTQAYGSNQTPFYKTLVSDDSNKIYCVVVTQGTPSFDATDDLSFVFEISKE